MVNSVAFKLAKIMKLFKIFISVLLCFSVVLSFCSCDKDDVTEEQTTENPITLITEEVKVENVADFEEKKPENSQIGVTVDSWLKIISLGEKDGVLSVFVRNTSDEDIQYALLSVNAGDGRAEFPITTLTAGASATLRCNNGYVFNDNVSYHSWKIADKAVFKEELSCYPDIFEIDGNDGYISIKNISDKDIEGKIYIYYKNVTDGVYDDGVTYRAYVDGLDKGENTQIQTQHYLKDTSRIMFVTYAE